MSSITNLLNSYVPAGIIDTIKGSNVNAVKSRLSGFLTNARTYFKNSDIMSSALSSCFLTNPELISDEIVSNIVPQEAIIARSDDAEVSNEMYQCIVDLFNRLGSDIEISDLPPGDRTAKQLSFSSNGVLFNIALVNRIFPGNRQFVLWKNGIGWSLEENLIAFTHHVSGGTVTDCYSIELSNTIQGADNNYYLLWDVIHSLDENAELNAALCNACDAFLNADSSTDGVMMIIQDFSASKYESVQQLARQLRTAWCGGGIYGAIMTIIQYTKTGTTAVESADGNLTFTDNSNYVPAVYTSGVVDTIVSTVTQLATVVAAGFARIFSIVASVVSSVVMGIIKAINYDYNVNTTASLVDSLGTGYPVGPWGLSQCEYDDSDWGSDLLANAEFAKGNGIWGSFVPGGIIIYTYSEEGKLRAEFHPDLVDRRSLVDTYIYKIRIGSGSDYGVKWNIPDRATLMHAIDSFQPTETTFTNNQSGVLDPGDDAHLRGIITANLLLYYMYLVSVLITPVQSPYQFVSHKQRTGSGSFERPVVYFRLPESMGEYCSLENFVEYGSHAFNFGNRIFGLAQVYCGLNTYDTQDEAWVGIANFAFACQGESTITDYTFQSGYFGQYTYPGGTFTLRMQWGFSQAMPFRNEFGVPYQLPLNFEYGILTPKYSRSSFIATAVGLIVTTAVVVAATAFATIAIRKKLQKVRAKNAAKVEQAWAAAADDPSEENIQAYRKACTKNNIMAKLYGGQTYSKESYWGETSSGGQSVIVSSLADNFKEDQADVNAVSDMELSGVDQVIQLIRGN